MTPYQMLVLVGEHEDGLSDTLYFETEEDYLAWATERNSGKR